MNLWVVHINIHMDYQLWRLPSDKTAVTGGIQRSDRSVKNFNAVTEADPQSPFLYFQILFWFYVHVQPYIRPIAATIF